MLLGLVLVLPLLALPAHAATFAVNSTADTDDGACNTSPDCTLREAVQAANVAPGADVITLPTGAAITLSLQAGGEMNNATAFDLDVTDDLTVQGNGATLTTSFAVGTATDTRFFQVHPGASLQIEDMTLNGAAVSGNGGAIDHQGDTLTVLRSSLNNNQAAQDGGAIFMVDNTTVVRDSFLLQNGAAGNGGGIGADDLQSLTVERSNVSVNSAGFLPPGGTPAATAEGGAINAPGAPGATVDIDQSTFSDNWTQTTAPTPANKGGAVHSDIDTVLTITNSYFVSNGLDLQGTTQTTDGGALHAEGQRLDIDNITVTEGRVNGDGAGLFLDTAQGSTIANSAVYNNTGGGAGGGLYSIEDPTSVVNTTISNNLGPAGGGGVKSGVAGMAATVDLEHVTLANNQPTNALEADAGSTISLRSVAIGPNVGPNCFGPGTFTSLGHNVEIANTCGLTGTGDQVNTDPQLQPLGDNGGIPQGAPGFTINGYTHALPGGSPAIDTADPARCGTAPIDRDQRNTARPQGAGCDVGAYEFVVPPDTNDVDVQVTKAVAPASVAVGGSATFTVTVTNVGPQTANGVTLTDTVPAGLTIGTVTTDTGTCSTAGQTVTCNLGSLASAATATITIPVTATSSGAKTNQANATTVSVDRDPSNDNATATLQVTDDGDGFPPPGGTRCEGPTRIETAINCAQEVFGDQEANAVVLTRSDLFPDAQAGTPLAIKEDAPMLLSEPATLNTATEAEIERVLAPGGQVYLLGGTAALSQAVEDRLVDLGYDVVRYGGVNRFDTAAIIAEQGLEDPDILLAANGGDFPDSVVAGAATLGASTQLQFAQADVNAAVILTSDDTVPPETQAYLDGREDQPTIIAIGGGATGAFPDSESVVGTTRFETSVAVAERFFDEPPVVGVATGLDFPDALAGGAIVGRGDIGPGPMLLTATDELPDSVADYLTDNADTIASAVIFGGEAAVSQDVEDEITTILSS